VRSFGLGLACALLATARGVAAGPRAELDLGHMLEEADFAFRGKVIDVSYRDAQPRADGSRGSPHAFVTYQVSDVYKGARQETVTLRFHGGPLDADRYIMSAEAPLFDHGDEDVLLVSGNTDTVCPLVSCADGRFRLIDGQVYSELGQTIEWTPSRSLVRGPAYALPAVLEHRMSDTIALRIEDSELDPNARPERESHARADDFATYLHAAVRESHTPEQLAALAPFRNADIAVPFMDESELGRALAGPEPEAPAAAAPSGQRARGPIAVTPHGLRPAAPLPEVRAALEARLARAPQPPRAETFGWQLAGLGAGALVLVALAAWLFETRRRSMEGRPR
jgi:hypothetical protein